MLVWGLRISVALGFATLPLYYSWWIHLQTHVQLALAVGLVAASFYGFSQIVASWILYLFARPLPEAQEPSPGLTIDVFLTSCNEPIALVEESLRACCALRGSHKTWLLDDGDDPRLKSLALQLGAGYLTRSDRIDRKAGNVNMALARTDGDIIAIFDADHVPSADFLERTVGHFNDPAVGFVQVMLSHSNEGESWIARAASQAGYDFYNPVQIGANAVGGATHVGSNGLLRRAALLSISGYRPGLAEDLATSIALHHQGWRSVYVAEPLAPGRTPLDLSGWITQQLKWSRGVFEVMLSDGVRLFPGLTWGQRLSYLLRFTYYLVGPVTFIHLYLIISVLFGRSTVAGLDFSGYFPAALPMAIAIVVVRQFAVTGWRHPSTPTTPLWRPTLLILGSWPVYTAAFLMAALRIPVRFRLTPKTRATRPPYAWLVGPALGAVLLVAGLLQYTLFATQPPSLTVVLIAVLQLAAQLTVLVLAVPSFAARGRPPMLAPDPEREHRSVLGMPESATSPAKLE